MLYQNREYWNITDRRVLAAMDAVPRAEFVLEEDRHRAGEDHPFSIGYGQTISQPFMAAYMTEALKVQEGHKVLEIGTGSGFQTAVLYRLSRNIFTVERIPQLASSAAARFDDLNYSSIRVKTGDGREGWPEEAPFDRIMVTAAPVSIPKALENQLAAPGRMVIPVGRRNSVQRLILVVKLPDGTVRRQELMSVSFVPLV